RTPRTGRDESGSTEPRSTSGRTPWYASAGPRTPSGATPTPSAGSPCSTRSSSSPAPIRRARRESETDARAGMRGILFTGFVEFMEQELPAAAGTVGIGAYSPLGSYPAEELLGLVARAGEVAGLPAPEVLRRFGAHLFRTLATLYPVFVDGVGSSLELLGG